MHCEQIRPLLREYTTGQLPSYKAAWTAQHLAGCPECRERLAQEKGRRAEPEFPVPVAAAAEDRDWAAANTSGGGMRRRARRRLARVFLMLALLLLGGAAWLLFQLWHQPGAIAHLANRTSAWFSLPHYSLAASPEPAAAAKAPPTDNNEVRFRSSMHRQLGVTFWIESITAFDHRLRVLARFEGEQLMIPAAGKGWLSIVDEQLNPVDYSLVSVVGEPEGILVEFDLWLKEGQDQFTLQVSEIEQDQIQHWALPLPALPDSLEGRDQPLEAAGSTISLTSYGKVDELLQVGLRVPAEWERVERLLIRDARGTSFAPADRTGVSGRHYMDLTVRYAIPHGWEMPLTLVGEGHMRKKIGPWTIEATVLK